MGWAWNALGAILLVVGILSCALAALVWGARSDRAQNRFLALYLFTGGLTSVVFNGLRLFMTDREDAYALAVAGWSMYILCHGAYVLFLSTLDSPVVAWMRRFGIRWVLAAGFVLLAVHSAIRAHAWFTGTSLFPGTSAYSITQTDLRKQYILVIQLVFIFSCVPALHAWRRAATPLARRRAKIVAIAFATTALSWTLFIAWYLGFLPEISGVAGVYLVFGWQAANWIFLMAGLGYGILSAQLYDIDLKLKWTIKRGTLAGIFVAVFFIVSQVAQNYLSNTGGLLTGGLVTGLVLFAINPLQKFAERLSDKALPQVQDTPDYAAFRKMEVYKAAVEELAVGGIAPKERRALDALRGKLGIAASDAQAMERDVTASGVA